METVKIGVWVAGSSDIEPPATPVPGDRGHQEKPAISLNRIAQRGTIPLRARRWVAGQRSVVAVLPHTVQCATNLLGQLVRAARLEYKFFKRKRQHSA